MKKNWLLVVIVIAMQACVPLNQADSPTPAFTSYVGGTETAIAASVPSELPTFSPHESSATPPVPETPTDFSPVMYGGKVYDTTFFLLLGGVSREVWLAPDLSVSRFSGAATYALHDMQYMDKYFLWGKSPEFSPTCQAYSIRTDAGLEESGFVATLDGWAVAEREVTELSEDMDVYRQVVIDWLEGEGVESPQIGTLRIILVDLEGDGVDEVFINATHLDESQHTTQAGDHSIILMRTVAGNEVVTTQILGDVYHSPDLETTFPRTYSLSNFIDLNQDGILEVIVEIRGWEKFGAIVYQIDEGDVIQTLRAEC